MTDLNYYDPRLTLEFLASLERQALRVEDFQRLHHRGTAANPVGHATYCRRILGQPSKQFDRVRGGNAATARRLKLCLDELERGSSWEDAITTALTLQPIANNEIPTDESNAAQPGGSVVATERSLRAQFHETSIFFALGAARIETGAYETAQRWRGPQEAWNAAQRSGLPVAILFGDATSDSGHVFRWAVVRDIQVGDDGTTIKWDSLRTVSRRASELTKLSDRHAIDDSFRRGYAVVHTPDWLQQWFDPRSTSQDVEEIGSPDAPDDLELELQVRHLRLRRHSSQFRENLMNAYGRCCAISGVAVEEVLEAAHIDSHAETGNNSNDNGLILRADLHVLFDVGLLLIEPESLTVRVARTVAGLLYRDLDGRPLRRPLNGSGPRRTALQKRWDKFSHQL